MKYIKEYKDIDWDDWDEEEIDPNGNIFLTIDEIKTFETIFVEDYDMIRFAQLLDDNNIRWISGDKTIQNGEISYIFNNRNTFTIRKYVNEYGLGYTSSNPKNYFRKK